PVAALGDELEAAVDPGVHPGGEEAGGEDLRVLHFPGRRAGAEVALVPGGLLRAGRAGVAAELDLLALPDEAGGRVGGADLSVQLGVPILERGLVADVVDGEQIDFRLGVGAPDPQPVAHDRTADLGAEILDLVDAVALLEGGLGVIAVPGSGLAEVALLEREIGLRAAGGLQVPGRAAPLVGAAL